jgi:hypothetical protein
MVQQLWRLIFRKGGSVASQDTVSLLEKLNELISRRQKRQQERPAYVESCRNLLVTIDRSADPYWWAALEAELGTTLANFYTPDRAIGLEEAIDAYQKALEVFTPKDYPTEWISTNGSLALAYRDRIEGVSRETSIVRLKSSARSLYSVLANRTLQIGLGPKLIWRMRTRGSLVLRIPRRICGGRSNTVNRHCRSLSGQLTRSSGHM